MLRNVVFLILTAIPQGSALVEYIVDIMLISSNSSESRNSARYLFFVLQHNHKIINANEEILIVMVF